MSAEVIVAGHICLDIIPAFAVEQLTLSPGCLVTAGPATLASGGVVSNTGLILSLLGTATALVGKIGDDAFGAALKQVLESTAPGTSNHMIQCPSGSTSYSIVLSAPQTDRMFIHSPGCNATFEADDVSDALLDSARLLHFGYPPLMRQMYINDGNELVKLFSRAKRAGITTSLDMSMPEGAAAPNTTNWSAILARVLPHVDIFTPSVEEMLLLLNYKLTPNGDPTDLVTIAALADQLLLFGARIIVLKMGQYGLYLRTADSLTIAKIGHDSLVNSETWGSRELFTSCFTVDPVGTTGSGDATVAGFLHKFLAGGSPQECVTAGIAVGAFSVEGPDAISGIRPWTQIEDRVRAGWPKRDSVINMYRWTWDQSDRVWYGPRDTTTGQFDRQERMR